MPIPRIPPDREQTVSAILKSQDRFDEILGSGAYSATVGDRYVHWDTLRYRTPPGGLTHEAWWGAIKLARMSQYKALPMSDAAGAPFQLAVPDPMQRLLSEADRDLGGRVAVPEQIANPGTRDRYVVSALIEEAITSSQLEGASTTRRVAADMLRSGRRPRDTGERMIFNNFQAMQFVRRVAGEPLTVDLICQIHRRITDGTMEDEQDAGRLRTSDDVRVYDRATGDEVHIPPPAAQLPPRMLALCDLANGKTPGYFVHPIVRAVLLHFWLAYDHPFVDGNGRTARALFYWSMLHSGYWLCEFLSISHVLCKAPSRYARAFLYTETDDNDTTYFVLFQLHALQRTVKALHEYVRLKMESIHRTQGLLKQSRHFNHRQLAVLGHALGNPDAQYTATSHATSHQVTSQTARTDLKELADLGLLVSMEVGKAFLFLPPPDLERRLARFGKSRRRGRG